MDDFSKELALGKTLVWYTSPEAVDETLEQALLHNILSGEEFARYQRFLPKKVKREFCTAHAMLRFAIASCSPETSAHEWQFSYDNYGKPTISFPRAQGLYFSLTHTSTLVACAISRQPLIGIDVEDANRKIDFASIAQRIFSRQEFEEFAIIESPNDRGRFFFTIWTLKEAFTKAIGKGLSMPVHKISFHVSPGQVLFEDPAQLSIPANSIPLEWHFDIHDVGEHRIALAQAGSNLQLQYRSMNLANQLENWSINSKY